MSNHKLPAKLIPYSIVLWCVRKYQLQETSEQLQEMKAMLLSFEIRYQDICGIQPIQNTIESNTNPQVKFQVNKYLFKEVALFLHPDHTTTKFDKAERYDDMIRATEAYHKGDEQELEVLLYKWRMRGCTGAEQNTQIKEWSSMIYSYCIEMENIRRSSMWTLTMKELNFALQGRNLLKELAILMQNNKEF